MQIIRVGLQIGIAPYEVGRWTPSEIRIRCEQIADKQNREGSTAWVRAAWMISYLLQPHMKKGKELSLDELLPVETLIMAGLRKPKPAAPKPKDRQKLWKELMSKFKGIDDG